MNMKKIKKIWNDNRIPCLFCLVLITVVVVFLSMILPMYAKNGDKYGNRLVGIEDVKIDKDTEKDIQDMFTSNENVSDVIAFTKGKILNVLINLNDNVDVNTLVDPSASVVDALTSDQLKFYDIQIFITSKISNEDEGDIEKTIVGYKNSEADSFSWTNNR